MVPAEEIFYLWVSFAGVVQSGTINKSNNQTNKLISKQFAQLRHR